MKVDFELNAVYAFTDSDAKFKCEVFAYTFAYMLFSQ